MLRLAVREKGKTERIFLIRSKRVSVGRGPGNDLNLENPHVSSRHAILEIDDASILFRDVGSTNGSMIKRGSKQIDVEAGGEAVSSFVGDTLVLGDSEEPVLLLVLDDKTGADHHPVDRPPDTAISQVPVDPTVAGHVLLRRAAKNFRLGDDKMFSSPELARLLYLSSLDLDEQNESVIVSNYAQTLMQLCPAVSHVLVQLSAGAEKRAEFRMHFVRGQKKPDSFWSAGRGGLYVRTVVAREAWLVERPVIETEGDDSLRLPMAICVPLLRPRQSLGYLFADNRASRTELDEQSLNIASALAESLAAMLDARRAFQERAARGRA